MTNKRIIALDTETTGLGNDAALLSLYATEFDINTGETGAYLDLAFNPGIHIPRFITDLTGFTDEIVKDFPLFSRYHANQIHDFLEGSSIWIHNKSFDERMIDLNLSKFGKLPLCEFAELNCSMALAKKMKHPKVGLNALCGHYGIDLSSRSVHGAKVDVELLIQLVINLNKVNIIDTV